MPRNLSAVFYEIATGRTSGAARRINSDSSFFRFYTPWIQTHRHQPNNKSGVPSPPKSDRWLLLRWSTPSKTVYAAAPIGKHGFAVIKMQKHISQTDRRSGGSRDSGYDTVYSLYDGGGKCVLFNQNRSYCCPSDTRFTDYLLGTRVGHLTALNPTDAFAIKDNDHAQMCSSLIRHNLTI